eukprot:s114_g15.t1
MWLDLEVFMELYTKMLPKNCKPPAVDELVALLYKHNKDTEQATAKSSGDGAKVGQIVQKMEGKVHSFAQSSASASAASASDYVAPTFGRTPMKVKPPPPGYETKLPGYAHQPKAAVPQSASPPMAKAPKPASTPQKEPPPQKKAALTSEPKAVPAAQPPVKIMEQKSKMPPGSPAKPKQPPAPPPPKPKGEEGAAEKKIAERRKEELRKLGVKYDFKGEFLRQLTRDQLVGLGITDSQDRGSTSPEADLLKRGKDRLKRAKDKGYTSVLDRFVMDTIFAESVLNDGENEYDCERYGLFALCHLPKPDRSKALKFALAPLNIVTWSTWHAASQLGCLQPAETISLVARAATC